MSSIRASRTIGALAAALTTLTLAGAAAAQASTQDAAMAETLFADAKKRMAGGDYAGACPKLSESYRLDPGGGTLTALALCHQEIGKTATAWAEFIEVQTAAEQAGRPDRAKYARQHIAALEPLLSRLTILVDADTARLADLVIHRDEVAIGSAAWGVASPVDPGEHVIEATAPGKVLWSTKVVLSNKGGSESVTIPELDSEAPAPRPAASVERVPPMGQSSDAAESQADTAQATHPGGTQRTIGIVLGTAGIASLGVGTYFGLTALSDSRDAKRSCSPSSCTSASAVATNDQAKTDAAVADGLLGGGLAAVLVGTVLFFSAPSEAKSVPASTGLRDVRVFPSIGRRGGQLVLQAVF